MRIFFLSLLALAIYVPVHSQRSFAGTVEAAKQDNRLILVSFSGSDWCVPCIRMKKDIFDDSSFLRLTDSALAFYNADFPRKRANAVETVRKKENQRLADRYNPEGRFPYTVLTDAEGTVLRAWDGFPEGGRDQFIRDIKLISHEHHR